MYRISNEQKYHIRFYDHQYQVLAHYDMVHACIKQRLRHPCSHVNVREVVRDHTSSFSTCSPLALEHYFLRHPCRPFSITFLTLVQTRLYAPPVFYSNDEWDPVSDSSCLVHTNPSSLPPFHCHKAYCLDFASAIHRVLSTTGATLRSIEHVPYKQDKQHLNKKCDLEDQSLDVYGLCHSLLGPGYRTCSWNDPKNSGVLAWNSSSPWWTGKGIMDGFGKWILLVMLLLLTTFPYWERKVLAESWSSEI